METLVRPSRKMVNRKYIAGFLILIGALMKLYAGWKNPENNQFGNEGWTFLILAAVFLGQAWRTSRQSRVVYNEEGVRIFQFGNLNPFSLTPTALKWSEISGIERKKPFRIGILFQKSGKSATTLQTDGEPTDLESFMMFAKSKGVN